MSIKWAKQLQQIDDIRQGNLEGIESVQLPVAVLMDKNTDFTQIKETLLSQGVTFDVFNSPLPKGLQVTKLGFNLYSWQDYLNEAVRRVAEMGGKVLVWSDGEDRMLPIEGDRHHFKQQFYRMVYALCNISEQYDITVCLEPLSEERTNFLNSPEEVMQCFSKIGKENLSLSIGLRNLVEMSLNINDLVALKEAIRHIHIENPMFFDETRSPQPTDSFVYTSFFNIIKAMDYSGVISLPSDVDEASLQYCRELLGIN